MQEYRSPLGASRTRSAESNVHGGVPTWLIEENNNQHDVVARTPNRNRHSGGNVTYSTANNVTADEAASRSTYAGLCGSPDTRRTFYRSSRQQQQQQQQQQRRNPGYQEPPAQNNPLQQRTSRPQHQMIGGMTRMPASEPIYMEIDPSIHQKTKKKESRERNNNSGALDPPSGNTTTTTSEESPSRSTHQQAPASTKSVPTTPSRTYDLHRYGKNNNQVGNTLMMKGGGGGADSSSRESRVKSTAHNKNTSGSGGVVISSSSNYPYVHPYVSPIAREYRASTAGGAIMFRHDQAPFTASRRRPTSPHHHHQQHYHNNNRRYDERPLNTRDPQQNYPGTNGEGMIMFGDDYDLGSINTGASQQELLQKRRDVKKRREGKYGKNGQSSSSNNKEGKYGKKKKSKEPRIINMPPRLLSMGSWDTSPITKLTSKDNSQHAPYKDQRHHSRIKDGKKAGQWNMLRSFNLPDEGSTDDSTRESGGDNHNKQEPHHQHKHQQHGNHQMNQSQSDNLSLSSFPLLSTNAKEGLTTEAEVCYAQPGNIPQLQVTTVPRTNNKGQPHKQQQHQREEHENKVLLQYPPPQVQQQYTHKSSTRSEHMEIYQRQHGEEILQLENHLRYLEEQHQQLEEEIQEKERFDQQQQQEQQQEDEFPRDEYQDDRPRSVRFAPTIAHDIEERYEKNNINGGYSQESPTSVAQFNANHQAADNSNSNSSTSVLDPTTLFPGKPKSILRRKKGSEGLDSTGRYPSSATTRGRSSHAPPVFTDNHGREVSPIRSPARHRGQQQQGVYQMGAPQPPEDVASIPDNPDHKDTAVLFDSDLELMRKEFDDDSSGLISDAFIEAVAAIVLQTAIRRFLAIRRVQMLRGAMNAQASGSKTVNVTQNRSPHPQAPSPTTADAAYQDQLEKQTTAKQVKFATPTEKSLEEHPLAAQEDFFYDLAAIQIQSVFRGWWVRDSINVDHYCTTLIQKTFRGFRARIQFDYDLYNVIIVQAMWRRNLVMRTTTHIFALVVRLQAVCRGFIIRKTMDGLAVLPCKNKMAQREKASPTPTRENQKAARLESSVRGSYERARTRKNQKQPPKAPTMQPSSFDQARIWHVGAIIIQTYWRSYVHRICYLQSVADVVVVQSIARRWLTRRWLGLSHHQTLSRNHHEYEYSSASAQHQHQRHVATRSNMSSSPQRPEARQQQQLWQQGHFNDPSRFGGPRTVWKPGTNPLAQTATAPTKTPQYNKSDSNINSVGASPSNPSNNNSAPVPVVRQQSGGYFSNTGSRNSKYNRQVATNTLPPPLPSPHSVPSTGRSHQEPPARSKGWNADEEIDKQGTRNLLMAWKQKDKANSFTIRRPGM